MQCGCHIASYTDTNCPAVYLHLMCIPVLKGPIRAGQNRDTVSNSTASMAYVSLAVFSDSVETTKRNTNAARPPPHHPDACDKNRTPPRTKRDLSRSSYAEGSCCCCLLGTLQVVLVSRVQLLLCSPQPYALFELGRRKRVHSRNRCRSRDEAYILSTNSRREWVVRQHCHGPSLDIDRQTKRRL